MFTFIPFQGLLPHLPSNLLSGNLPTSISILVDGSIPPESSLSSSAAMTVCSSLVILQSLVLEKLLRGMRWEKWLLKVVSSTGPGRARAYEIQKLGKKLRERNGSGENFYSLRWEIGDLSSVVQRENVEKIELWCSI